MPDDLYMVAYDIRDRNRLRRMRRFLARFFRHGYLSVFECRLDRNAVRLLQEGAKAIMDTHSDQLCLMRIDWPETALQTGGAQWCHDPHFIYVG